MVLREAESRSRWQRAEYPHFASSISTLNGKAASSEPTTCHARLTFQLLFQWNGATCFLSATSPTKRIHDKHTLCGVWNVHADGGGGRGGGGVTSFRGNIEREVSMSQANAEQALSLTSGASFARSTCAKACSLDRYLSAWSQSRQGHQA